VNEDISNLDDSINLNLWALNEVMDFNVQIKEKISVVEKKLINGSLLIQNTLLPFDMWTETLFWRKMSFGLSIIFQKWLNKIL
jgi:hypothetical protein